MSEPYVPIADLTTASTLLAELEVSTDAAESFTDDLETAVANALTHKQTAEALVASGFELVFLVGA